ncbi:SsrA-binding protein SmpB [Candidatus Daviesbacteria bacterium]|nr:SsrA-binding protein SmpB [Candidatus Daviesbacteria bacterium]
MKIVNKKAYFNYHILETLEVGVVLSGGEVKSLRLGRADLSGSFARVKDDQIFLINAYIPAYQNSPESYDPKRTRKLLLHKTQILNLATKVHTGKVLIPLSIYSTRNLIKVQLALATSKKKYDKKQAKKLEDEQRKLDQELKDL